jgi:hypothetical protein
MACRVLMLAVESPGALWAVTAVSLRVCPARAGKPPHRLQPTRRSVLLGAWKMQIKLAQAAHRAHLVTLLARLARENWGAHDGLTQALVLSTVPLPLHPPPAEKGCVARYGILSHLKPWLGRVCVWVYLCARVCPRAAAVAGWWAPSAPNVLHTCSPRSSARCRCRRLRAVAQSPTAV